MLESTLVAHCAPTLAKIKVGSLFSASVAAAGQVDALNSLLAPKGVALKVVRRRGSRALYYLYRPQELAQLMAACDTQALLRRYGYTAFTPSKALKRLMERLACCGEFPHEIGVFLGYPLGDVEGFITNCGQNCRCCGLWKAYGDAREAQRTFARYRKCTEVYTRLYAQGRPLERLTVQTKTA